jgi:hypothetical protein
MVSFFRSGRRRRLAPEAGEQAMDLRRDVSNRTPETKGLARDHLPRKAGLIEAKRREGKSGGVGIQDDWVKVV